MKTVCKKLLSLMLVAILLVSALPIQALAVAVGDPVAIYYCLEGEEAFFVGKGKIGSKVTAENYIKGEDAQKQYNAINGKDGKEFVGWRCEATGTYVRPMKEILSANMLSGEGDIVLEAVFDFPADKITLKPNGGKLTGPKTHEVKLNEQYDFYGGIADPTRTHYDFTGWKTSDGTMVYNDSVVTSLSDLTAQWALKDYNVVFEAYVMDEGWTEVTTVTVKALSTLSVANGTFPSDADIAASFALEGWKIVGWEIGATDAAFKAGSTKVEKDGLIVRPRYQKDITLYADDKGQTYKTGYTVELGEPVGAIEKALPYPGVRNGQTFKAWYTTSGDLASDKDNLSKPANHAEYYPEMGDLWGAWEPSATVLLYFHTNGNTQNAAHVEKYFEAPAEGNFDLSKLNLYELFPDYSKYDDDGDKKYGWYTHTEWLNYCAGQAASPYDIYTDLGESGLTQFYIMLIDNGNNTGNNGGTNGDNTTGGNANGTGNNYNNNTNTADPSNPTTGDGIYMAMTVMAVSACALLLVFFFNKKRQTR